MADLDEAIMAQQQAVHLAPNGHPEKLSCLNNLGISFQSRFERLGDLAYLGEAITAMQQAVHLTSDGRPDKPGRPNSLEISFRSLPDLDEAIYAQQQATRLTQMVTPNGSHVSEISSVFGFSMLGSFLISEANASQKPAFFLTPDKSGRLNNLGTSLFTRSTRQPHDTTLAEATKCSPTTRQVLVWCPTYPFGCAFYPY